MLIITQEPKNDLEIIIHVLPHTHLDAGWIETFDNYYDLYVSSIFDTLVPELESNPDYRFNWAEVGYLEKWWNMQNELTQYRFKTLVEMGQIQFVGGGWV